VRETIDKFIRRARDDTIQKLERGLEVALFTADSSVAIQGEINSAVKSLASRGETTNPSRTDLWKTATEVWETLYDKARRNCTTKPFEDIFKSEIQQEYFMKVSSAVLQGDGGTIDLPNLPAYTHWGTAVQLVPNVANVLVEDLQNAGLRVIDDRQYYTEGMLSKLKATVLEISTQLEQYNKITLQINFKVAMHIFACKKFHDKIKEKHEDWESVHSLTHILNNNKREMLSLIKKRLEFGFSFVGEAQVISGAIYARIKQAAKSLTENSHAKAVLALSWLQDASTIRLKYFRQLLAKLMVSNCVNARTAALVNNQ
jgi:hypothetical protein